MGRRVTDGLSAGFDGEHPDIDLLRLRNYTIGASLADEDVLGEHGMHRIADLLASLKPFVSRPILHFCGV